MVANGGQEPSSRNLRRLKARLQNARCLKSDFFHYYIMHDLRQFWRFPNFETQPVRMPKIARFLHSDSYYKIHEFSMQICTYINI